MELSGEICIDSNFETTEKVLWLFFCKHLDLVAVDWPAYTQAIADTTTLLIQETDKLTMEQKLIVTTPYSIEILLQGASEHLIWSNKCLTHYQALFLNAPRIRFSPSSVLNPESLLPDPEEQPDHDCV